MKQNREREYPPRRWVLFDAQTYHWAWADKKLRGIAGCFAKDLKCCRQRIEKGYCDVDAYGISDWFFEVVPAMLAQYKKTRRGSPGILGQDYTDEHGILTNDTCHEEWDEILDRIVFLFREADELFCQRENPCKEEHRRVHKEFEREYGRFGEKLETPQEKERMRRTGGGHVIHTPSEIPKYAQLEAEYYEEERKLEQYREDCKDEAFRLFSKWFFHLWG